MFNFALSLRSGLRKSTSALSEYIRLLWLLVKRVGIAVAWWAIAVGLPIYGFIAEGPGAATMRTSLVSFFSGSLEAVNAARGIAAASAIAICTAYWVLFQRYVSKSKIPEIMDIHRHYMDYYEHVFEEHIMAPSRAAPLGQDGYNLVKDKVNGLLVKLCTELAKSFEKITGGKCCASFKMYNPNDKTITTSTRGEEQDYKRGELIKYCQHFITRTIVRLLS
jgi:hypothetical protein